MKQLNKIPIELENEIYKFMNNNKFIFSIEGNIFKLARNSDGSFYLRMGEKLIVHDFYNEETALAAINKAINETT